MAASLPGCMVLLPLPHLCMLTETVHAGTRFNPTINPPAMYVSNIISPSEYAQAMDMARGGRYHRKFEFGRSGSQWTINGESWHEYKLAAPVRQCTQWHCDGNCSWAVASACM
jgi:hypothetical protein